jgi:hypothetical protein
MAAVCRSMQGSISAPDGRFFESMDFGEWKLMADIRDAVVRQSGLLFDQDVVRSSPEDNFLRQFTVRGPY